jgi:predicted MFS family arabinose efflux permease
VGGLIAMAAAVGISRFVYTPILPVMVEALSLSRSQAGLIASANFLGYLVGALLVAMPSLPGSRRGWMLGGLLVSGVTTGAMGLVSSLPGFLVARFLGGGASAFVLVLASVLVLDRLGAMGRARLSPVHFGGVGAGIAMSALTVSVLLAKGAGWRLLWFAAGAIVLVATVVVGRLVPADNGRRPERVGVGEREGRRGLGRAVCAYCLFGVGYIVTATFLVAIVRASPEARGIEPLVWLVVGIAAVPSVAFWSTVADRFGVRRAFSVACLVEAIGVAASVGWPSAAGALIAAALLGGTFMGLTALGFAQARLIAPDDPRPVFALMTAGFGVGQVVGPSLAGYLSDRTGGFMVPSLLAAGALVVAAVIVLGGRAPAGRVPG